MKTGIFGYNITVEEGQIHNFLNTPFKSCVDFIYFEAGYSDINFDNRKIHKLYDNYNIQCKSNREKEEILSIINNFSGNVIIESDFNSCIAIGMYKEHNRDIGKKAKYHNDNTAKEQMLQELLNFINKSTLYKYLIDTETVLMSIPRNRNKSNQEDLSEWLAHCISEKTGLENITQYFEFFKNGDLKPDIVDGEIRKKEQEKKQNILNGSELWFSSKLNLYKNKKIIIIDNMHDSGLTTNYIASYLKWILHPREIHCLYYSKI